MKNMINLIIGLVLLAIAYLIILDPFQTTVNHYTVVALVNDEHIHTWTFSITNNKPFTIELLRKKFDLGANDKVIITDIKSITQEQKDFIVNSHNDKKLKQ